MSMACFFWCLWTLKIFFILFYFFLKLKNVYFYGKVYCYKYSSMYMSISNSQSIPPSCPSPLVMVPNIYSFSSSSLCCCSAAHSCLTLCDPMDCSTPSLPEILQCHIFLSFYTVHEVLPASTLGWFASPSSSGSYFVRTLLYDPTVLGGPTQHVS